jgi:NADH-quinone oxidoreductase subunit I
VQYLTNEIRRPARGSSPRKRITSACCASCPDWDLHRSHKGAPLRRRRLAGSVACSTVSDIDYAPACTAASASRCPFDAHVLEPEFEYLSADRRLLHDKDKLGEWMDTVPEPEPLERGAQKGKK